MELSEAKLIELGRSHLEQLPAVRDLWVKYGDRLNYGGEGAGARYRVVVYLAPPPVPLEELKKISVAGEGPELPLMAFCELDRESGAIVETKLLMDPGTKS